MWFLERLPAWFIHGVDASAKPNRRHVPSINSIQGCSPFSDHHQRLHNTQVLTAKSSQLRKNPLKKLVSERVPAIVAVHVAAPTTATTALPSIPHLTHREHGLVFVRDQG